MNKKKLHALFKKNHLVLLSLAYFLFANTMGLIEDIKEDYQDDQLHLIYEGFISLLTVIAVYIVWREAKAGYDATQTLEKSIQHLDQDNLNYSKQVMALKHELFQVVVTQLKDWLLSKSEQEIAILLLKGLSLKEISQIRETKEKTIRQQASAIYKKADLKGRHELSAYFFEDLL